MAIAVGIDLGTTNTVVAAVLDGTAVTLTGSDGARLLPSVVSFHPSGSVLVGRGALERRLLDAPNTIYSVKRLIGRPWASPEVAKAIGHLPFRLQEGPKTATLVAARGDTYSLSEISAFVLRQAKAIAEEATGAGVERAVITVPANFNDLQRAATKTAGRLAGLDVLRILNEPTAAALAYGPQDHAPGKGERVAVYDLGGGTFDITVLDLVGNVFEVLATAGDTALGGDDIDVLVAERMADELLKKHRMDARPGTPGFARLRILAEEMKRELSSREEHVIVLNDLVPGDRGATVSSSFRMTRPELEWSSLALIDRTLHVCGQALTAAGISPAGIDRVLLVGGATRMPMVARKVEQFFGRAPVVSINPDEVVALGAAIQAELLDRSRSRTAATAASPKTPAPAVQAPLRGSAGGTDSVPNLPVVSAGAAADARAGAPPQTAPSPPRPTRAVPPPIPSGRPAKGPARTLVPSVTVPAPGPAKTAVPSALAEPAKTLAPSVLTSSTKTLVPSVLTGSTKTLVPSVLTGASKTLMPSVLTVPTKTLVPSTAGGEPAEPFLPRVTARPLVFDVPASPQVPSSRSGGLESPASPPAAPPDLGLEGSAFEASPPAASSLGRGSEATAPAALSLGRGSEATAPAALSLGRGSEATAPAASSLGRGSEATAPPAAPSLGPVFEAPALEPVFDVELDELRGGRPVAPSLSPAAPSLSPAAARRSPRTPDGSGKPTEGVPPALPPAASPASPEAVARAVDSPTRSRERRTAPLLIDVTPFSLSVETVGGFCDFLIDANTPVPCDRTRSFATASDGQTSVCVRVAQGESRRFAENTFLGEVELSGIAAAPRGAAPVAVTFEIDADGILNVSARDVKTGRQTAARIQLVGGTDATELDAMRARQAAHPVVGSVE